MLAYGLADGGPEGARALLARERVARQVPFEATNRNAINLLEGPALEPCMFAFMNIYHLVVGLWVCGHQGRCPHTHNRALDRCGSSSKPWALKPVGQRGALHRFLRLTRTVAGAMSPYFYKVGYEREF
jgi:hypothetical protein